MADEIEVFQKNDLPNLAFPVFEDIRRQGKLCDVTLKVVPTEKNIVQLVLIFNNKFSICFFWKMKQEKSLRRWVGAQSLELRRCYPAYEIAFQRDFSENTQSAVITWKNIKVMMLTIKKSNGWAF